MKRYVVGAVLLAVAASQSVLAHGDHEHQAETSAAKPSAAKPSAQELAAIQELAAKAALPMKQTTRVGNGTARSWVKRDKTGKPTSLGLTLSEGALSGLERDVVKGFPVAQFHLSLPKEAQVTGFDHITLDWNPLGHPPKGIYDAPHFDVHFYMMKASELSKITLAGDDMATCIKAPEARFMPAGYIMPPDTAVPLMGAHAIDTAAPELHGKPFTTTFIYGFYNGQMNFLEPMVTMKYLQSKPNFSAPVKLPAAYASSGYYPTRYSIRYDARRREYSISLDGLTFRKAASAQRVATTSAR
jgi:hypothetical protein